MHQQHVAVDLLRCVRRERPVYALDVSLHVLKYRDIHTQPYGNMEAMEEKPNRLKNDELDDAIIAADDTGLITEQHAIIEEEILEHVTPEEDESSEEG